MKRIHQEIQQEKFASAEQELMVNLLFTAKQLEGRIGQLLKPYGLSHAQYNVLRILKGQKGEALSVKAIASRMMDRNSNVSRLIDKLLKNAWVERVSCPADRRQVDVRILPKGLNLIKEIGIEFNRKGMDQAAMNEVQLQALSKALDEYRNHKLNIIK